MNRDMVEKIAQAVLYEGYILYPYRPSVKNSHRWTFGGLYPREYGESQKTADPWSLLTECIVLGDDATTLEIKSRFLHLIDRNVAKVNGPSPQPVEFVDSVIVDGKKYQRWQEAVERDVAIPAAALREFIARPLLRDFSFAANQSREDILDAEGRVAAVLIRQQQEIAGTVEVSAEKINEGVFKVSLRVCNRTSMAFRRGASSNSNGRKSGASPDDTINGSARSMLLAAWVNPAATDDNNKRPLTESIRSRVDENENLHGGSTKPTRDEALMRALVSTHAILGIKGGRFVSMTDPPIELKDAVESCRNVGVWPVLVGDQGATDAMLASPIILPDYPQIAPESPGDLFDGGEIDEILSLRIMTLTDEEKRDVSSVDPRADVMLKRTENLAREQLMNLHGGMRNVNAFPAPDVFFPTWDPMADRPKLPSIRAGGVDLHPGDRVRLRPRGGADAFDMMLDGKIATIAVIEQDYEDRIHLAVTVEDDPGADFGMAGKPGHRFFFRPDEVEPLDEEIGNTKSELRNET